MKKRLAIWGAGRNGYVAYHAYRDKYDIGFYVDSDENKWNTFLNGIPVKKPDELRNNKILVLIALRWGVDVVKRKLAEEYGIENFIVFSINEDDSIILTFGGGLGNQLFQYALYKRLETMGKCLYADLSLYNNPQAMRFEIADIFSNVKIKKCNNNTVHELIKRNTTDFFKPVSFTIYSEASIYDMREKKADMNLLNISSGIIKGMFQTREFAEQIKAELIETLVFPTDTEKKLHIISEQFKEKNIIGIHIRRGDYLDDANKRFYENICTDSYYQQAIEYVIKLTKDGVLCFFSDDIEWVKRHYKVEDAIYVEEKMFDHYQSWYDMYLMSICSHNIIANSTFSWWGAWLNQNPDKIVIAPKKWVNQCEYIDIYPEGWIRM